MASSDNQSSHSAEIHHDRTDDFINPQDQMLIAALQQFIMPHVGVANGGAGTKEILLRPEARELVKALNAFISSVLRRSERQEGTTITVNVDDCTGWPLEDRPQADNSAMIWQSGWDNESDIGDNSDQGSEYTGLRLPRISTPDDMSRFELDQAYAFYSKEDEDAGASEGDASPKTAPPSSLDAVSTLADIFSICDDIFDDYKPFNDYVLRGLREHVFNKLPIRLLRFVPQLEGSHLEITLIEKEAIYAHLAPIMEAHKYAPDYQPITDTTMDRVETYDEAVARLIKTHAGYAILSHTWLHGSHNEVTYADWTSGLFDLRSAGYRKLVNFCKVAWKNHGLTLGWMDTVCINKDSSSELDESIRSMFNWYQRSKVCIIYLAATQERLNINRDPWFTRGWTLQELLAPVHFKFYNQDWRCFIRDISINDKEDLASEHIRVQIYMATTIAGNELTNIGLVPLSRLMQLAASRKVTREEDGAYSLMGIFGVSIAIAYGEGADRAFFRLLQEIMNSRNMGVLDLFNFAGEIPWAEWRNSYMLPSSPMNYNLRSPVLSSDHLQIWFPHAPLALTHMGLHIPVLLIPGTSVEYEDGQHEPIGDFSARAIVTFKRKGESTFTTNTFHFLDKRAFFDDDDDQLASIHTAAVFNIAQGSQGIYVPRLCIAKLIYCAEDPGQVLTNTSAFVAETDKPLAFDIEYSGQNIPDNEFGFWIPENELATHGMQFVSLYL